MSQEERREREKESEAELVEWRWMIGKRSTSSGEKYAKFQPDYPPSYSLGTLFHPLHNHNITTITFNYMKMQ